MTKGSYTLRENVPSEYDSSYRSCLCALLLFTAICLVAVCTSFFWTFKVFSENFREFSKSKEFLSGQKSHSKEEIKLPSEIPSTPSTAAPENLYPTTLFEEATKSSIEFSIDSTTNIEKTTTNLKTESFQENLLTSTTPSTIPYDTVNTDTITSTFKTITTSNYKQEGDFNEELEITSTTSNTFENYYDEPRNQTTESFSLSTSLAERSTNFANGFLNYKTFTPTEKVYTKILEEVQPGQKLVTDQYNDQFPQTEINLHTTRKYTEKNNSEKLVTTDDRIIFNGSISDHQANRKFNESSNSNSSKKLASETKREITESVLPSSTPMTCVPQVISPPTTPFPKSEPVCLTTGCKSAASRMLNLMDHSIDACEDFYQFSCGNGQEKWDDFADANIWTAIEEETSKIDETYPKSQQKFSIFYKKCIQYEYIFEYENRVNNIKQLVEEVGNITLSPEDERTIDLTELFAKLILRSSLPFMDIYVEENKQNSSFVFQLTLPGTSPKKQKSPLSRDQKRCFNEIRHKLVNKIINLDEIHNEYLNCLKNHSIYLNSIENVIKALGVFSSMPLNNQTKNILALRMIIEWNILDLVNFDSLNVQKSIAYKKYKVLKISDLQQNYPLLDWKKLFEILGNRKVNEGVTVHVYSLEYFSNLFRELRKTSKRNLNNALVAIYATKLFETLVVSLSSDNREDYCLKLTSYTFPDISSYLYSKIWPTKKKQEIEEFFTKMFIGLKKKLSQNLGEVDWLDDATRTAFLLKIQSLNIAYEKADDDFQDRNIMENKYSSLNLSDKNFARIFVEADIQRKKAMYDLEGQIFSTKSIWGHIINSFDIIPLTVYSRRITIIPQAVLRKYDISLPSYISKAQVGFTLAREIGYHFDSVGKEYGLRLKGSHNSTYTSMETFMKNILLKEITRTLGKHILKLKIDPELSMKQRIADNTGMRLVTEFFENSYTEPLLPWIIQNFSREKLFLIAIAQEYCQNLDVFYYMVDSYESEILPSPLRVENIVSNSEFFSSTFKCPEGSKMNDNPAKSQFPFLTKSEDYAYYENENYKDQILN